MVRKHDYELKIDITANGDYNLTHNLNPYLKPNELLLITKLLNKQEDQIHKLIVGKNNIIKK